MTEKMYKTMTSIVAEARISTLLDYEEDINDIDSLRIKYKALIVFLDKIHETLIKTGELAEDEKKLFLIINLTNDEQEQTQAD